MDIVIIDYGMGNLRSVYNAFKFLGAQARISDSPDNVKKADKLVLPGVGAFRDAVEGLKKNDLILPIKDFLRSGRDYLGICLGLQLLFEESQEGGVQGLGVLKGGVRGFKKKPGVKIPHMGWNTLNIRKPGLREMKSVKDDSYFYFVHSYYADPLDKGIEAAGTEYCGLEFCSMIVKDNICATQFHPEKSQAAGLTFLKNFVEK